MTKTEIDQMRNDSVEFACVFLGAEVPPWQAKVLHAIASGHKLMPHPRGSINPGKSEIRRWLAHYAGAK